MGTNSSAKAFPQVVKLDKAFKLAEALVNNMSGSTVGKENEVEFEGRPPRLGLGAKITRHAEVAASTDPVERKLLGKLGVGKRGSSKDLGESDLAKRNGKVSVGKRHSSSRISEESDASKLNGSSDEDDDEPESRTSVFDKRKTLPDPPSQAKKKQKGLKSGAV